MTAGGAASSASSSSSSSSSLPFSPSPTTSAAATPPSGKRRSKDAKGGRPPSNPAEDEREEDARRRRSRSSSSNGGGGGDDDRRRRKETLPAKTSAPTAAPPAPPAVRVMVAGGASRPSSRSPPSPPPSTVGGGGTGGGGAGAGSERRRENRGRRGGDGRTRYDGVEGSDEDDDEDEFESVDGSDDDDDDDLVKPDDLYRTSRALPVDRRRPSSSGGRPSSSSPPSSSSSDSKSKRSDLLWLALCFLGIMLSFVCYGLLLEYTTSGGRKLHELSFLFVTSALYTVTAAAGRYVRDETPTTIPPARFAVLGLTSMGSTFCSVRSLRYVIYPIQVLAKSCKPVPVMIMGAFMGKKYPLKKYVNVVLIVVGVALFMGGGDSGKKSKKGAGPAVEEDGGGASPSQMVGILLLFVSLCFDGGTGAYEDKLMSVHSVGPFDLMYNIQLGKTILAGVGLLVLNQVHVFLQMCQEMGFLLVALGLSGAMGQVFIFVTISKFGALTCSIIGLARKVTTLVASIYFYGHSLNGVQFGGLAICIGAMVSNFAGKKGGKGGGGGHGHGGGGGGGGPTTNEAEEERNMLDKSSGHSDGAAEDGGDVEMGPVRGNRDGTSPKTIV